MGECEMITCRDFLKSFITGIFATVSLSDVTLIGPTEGHIWEGRSGDDGRTWSDPKPTTLVHPDTTPMIFHFGDDHTLIVFIHNSYDHPGRPRFDKYASK
jgi:hypothetical protein